MNSIYHITFRLATLFFCVSVISAVDITINGVGLSFPGSVVPFVKVDANPIVIVPDGSIRLVIPAKVEGEFAATIDVASMPSNLSLVNFWPEYLTALKEEADVAGDGMDWRQGVLQGKTALAVAKGPVKERHTTKVYMLSLKDPQAFFSVEVCIAAGQGAKEIESLIDDVLAKAKPIEKRSP